MNNLLNSCGCYDVCKNEVRILFLNLLYEKLYNGLNFVSLIKVLINSTYKYMRDISYI